MSLILNPCLHAGGGGEFDGSYSLESTSAPSHPWRYVDYKTMSGSWDWISRISGSMTIGGGSLFGTRQRITYNGTDAVMYVDGVTLATVAIPFTNAVQFGLAASGRDGGPGTLVYENFVEA